MNEEAIYYVYVYLDSRKPGRWEYKDWVFLFQPFYVGMGKYNRIDEHVKAWSLSKNYPKDKKIKKIVRETGSNPYYFKVVEGLAQEKAWEEEISMIKFFGRVDLKTGILSNLTDGGIAVKKPNKARLNSPTGPRGPNCFSRFVIQKTLDGDVVNIWNSATEASKAVGLKQSSPISAACEGRSHTSMGFKWEYGSSSYTLPKEDIQQELKIVFQYSLEGNFLKSFTSAKEAGKELGLKKRKGWNFIQSCALGARNIKAAYGFRWFYSYQGEKIEKVKTKTPARLVSCYDLEGNFLRTYESINKAQIDKGITWGIKECCKLPFMKKPAGGFYWSFSPSEKKTTLED